MAARQRLMACGVSVMVFPAVGMSVGILWVVVGFSVVGNITFWWG